jgi:hypothetical protein
MSEVNLVMGIEVDGQKFLLSKEAAKHLYEALKDIFEVKKEIQYVPWTYPAYVPQYYPVYPVCPNIVINKPCEITWYNTCANNNGYAVSISYGTIGSGGSGTGYLSSSL